MISSSSSSLFEAKLERLTKSFLQMKKFDVTELEKAAHPPTSGRKSRNTALASAPGQIQSTAKQPGTSNEKQP